MALTLKVSETGALELPDQVSESPGWLPGPEIEAVEERNSVRLRPKAETRRDAEVDQISIDEFLAKVPKGSGPHLTDEEIDRILTEEAVRRFNATRS